MSGHARLAAQRTHAVQSGLQVSSPGAGLGAMGRLPWLKIANRLAYPIPAEESSRIPAMVAVPLGGSAAW